MLTAILTARTMLIKRFFICKVLLESKIFPVCYRQIIVFILTLLNGHCNKLQRSNAMYFTQDRFPCFLFLYNLALMHRSGIDYNKV